MSVSSIPSSPPPTPINYLRTTPQAKPAATAAADSASSDAAAAPPPAPTPLPPGQGTRVNQLV
jgi:hypothetical protein